MGHNAKSAGIKILSAINTCAKPRIIRYMACLMLEALGESETFMELIGEISATLGYGRDEEPFGQDDTIRDLVIEAVQRRVIKHLLK